MNKEQIIKIFKNKNNRIILLIFIIGVVLMAFSGGRKEYKTAAVKNEPAVSSAPDEEERLCAILSEIEGAGDVSVMITYYSGTEKSLAYDKKTFVRSAGDETGEDVKAVMADGEPMVVKEVYPRVKGVIIAAEGADSARVRSALSEAAAAALDVGAHKICIFKKEED